MSDIVTLSDEEWAHEAHYMAQAGFSDLYELTVDPDRLRPSPDELNAMIATAFGLIRDGMGYAAAELVENEAEFLAAASSETAETRKVLFAAALANLSTAVGFEIGA